MLQQKKCACLYKGKLYRIILLTVSAAPITSILSLIAGANVNACIGVGEVNPFSASAVKTGAGTNRFCHADMSRNK